MAGKLRVLLVAAEVKGLPPLAWLQELSQIAAVPGVTLEVCGGQQAQRATVAERLHEWWDCILWSGHGAPGRLLLADGPVGGDWLACMMRQAPPSVVVLSACFSAARDQALTSLAETLSQSGITTVGLWAGVMDAAAVVYNVEFVRALALSGSVATAHRVAIEQVAWEHSAAAGAAFLLPGLINGYGKIVEELSSIHKRLDDMEAKLDRLCARPDVLR
ncbi:MAG: CHAT domain protein [Chloroflexi bacterium ADurb.Bin325]|nr:MAG: CHAT domain protein [Chloroflexi bacterium ADurb.Bin325]